MDERRLVIYLVEKDATNKTKAFAAPMISHSYAKRITEIITKKGQKKSTFVRECLMQSFGTNSVSELRQAIYYASENQNKTLCNVCKVAIKKAVDRY